MPIDVRCLRDLDDAVLVDRSRARERAAFEELVRRHADRLYAVVLRLSVDAHEAEEITQESFLRAWRGIERFERRSQFFTWLYRIGVNEAKRRAQRRLPAGQVVSLDHDPVAEAPDGSDAPELRAEQGDVRRVLEAAIRTLPPDYRAPLILRDVEGLTTTEAAEIMDLGEAAFKSRLHRARLAVRRALDEYFLQCEGAVRDEGLVGEAAVHARARVHVATVVAPRRRRPERRGRPARPGSPLTLP